MSDNLKTTPTRKSPLRQAWDRLTAPSPGITDVGEQRSARLASSFLFIVASFGLLSVLIRAPRTGLDDAFSGGVGISLISSFVAYLISRTRWYRAAILIFSISFASTAYLSMVIQGADANFDRLILIYVPISLIVASAFVSPWVVLLLMGLNVGALYLARAIGAPVDAGPALAGAGMITVIGVILIVLANFRNNVEKDRLEEARAMNRKLEELTAALEQGVEERAADLEKANRQITRRAFQLQAITELSEAIARLQDLNELLPVATRLISERFGFYHVGIFLVDGDQQFAILQAANSEGGRRMLARGHRLKLGTGVVGFAAQSGKPRIALDVGRDAVFFNNPDLPETRSEAALPLRSREEVIGVLDVQSTQAGAFTNEDLQVLSALANQVAIAFENARLLTETRAALTQAQEVYNEFTRVEWSRAASQAGHPGFRYNAGRIELLETELQTPELASAVESGQVAANQPNGSREKRSALAVPVKLRGEVIGVLHVESNDPSKTWQADEIGLVEAVAERAAYAMENARLFQEARRRAAKEQLISEASAKIGGAINLENILQTTAEELERVLGGSEILIQFQNKEQA
ncbi:GAF domain-containing protein [Chloroflexi bacterium CFX6]|nr:GAF domain-containing protein [Chloroflexi bacterium CFX6]